MITPLVRVCLNSSGDIQEAKERGESHQITEVLFLAMNSIILACC